VYGEEKKGKNAQGLKKNFLAVNVRAKETLSRPQGKSFRTGKTLVRKGGEGSGNGLRIKSRTKKWLAWELPQKRVERKKGSHESREGKCPGEGLPGGETYRASLKLNREGGYGGGRLGCSEGRSVQGGGGGEKIFHQQRRKGSQD